MRTDLIPFLGSWMLTYLLHSSLLLGGAWLASRRLIQGPAARDLLWKAALLGGIATATIQLGLGFEPLGGAVSLRLGPVHATPLVPHWARAGATQPDAWRGLLLSDGQGDLAGSDRAREAAPVLRAPATLPAAASADVTPGVPAWLMPAAIGVWATVALALSALYLVQRLWAMHRIGPRRQVSDAALLDLLDSLRRSAGIRRVIRLTAAPGLASPVALGRDEIAVPDAALTDLDPEQQRSMLAHELAHLERRDPSWLALGCLVERIFFLQPLNRLARVGIQEAAEYLCDDWAVRCTGSGVSLATCLVKVAEWVDTIPRPIPLAGMAEHRSQLVTRIHRLIEGRVMPATPRSIWLFAGAIVLVGTTAVAAPGITALTMDLVAQDTALAKAPGSDSSAAWPERVRQQVRLAMSRARLDMQRARLDAMRAQLAAERNLVSARAATIAPIPPVPPIPDLEPRLGVAIARGLARAPRAMAGGRARQGDTTSIAVPALILALKDGDVEVRRAAVQSLSNYNDPRAILAFIDALRDTDPEVRACAASALGGFEDKRAIPGLVALLKDQNKEVRRAAISSLANFSDQVPAEAIVAALRDTDPDVRTAALGLASRQSDEDKPADPRVVQAVAGLIGDSNADVRSQAAEALSSLNLKEAPAGLLAAAKDKNAEVRQHVAEALGSIRDSRAVPVLKELLQDPNADVRESAVGALGQIRDRSALEALVGALKSSDASVRRRAAEELGQRDEDR